MDQRAQFERDLSEIDYVALEQATIAYDNAQYRYTQSRGFFSCNSECQEYKADAEIKKLECR